MSHPVSDSALDLIFRKARTANAWLDEDVPEVLIRAVYDLAKMGPTSANCSPARFLWVRSSEAKQKLADLAIDNNKPKIRNAPWTVIIAWDEQFEEKIPELFPHNPGAKDWFGDAEVHYQTAFRNGTLQGAYLMLAARAMGLDCGPMSGFDNAGVDAAFFAPDEKRQHWKSNFICAIGHVDVSGTFPRSPRLSFEDSSDIA